MRDVVRLRRRYFDSAEEMLREESAIVYWRGQEGYVLEDVVKTESGNTVALLFSRKEES